MQSDPYYVGQAVTKEAVVTSEMVGKFAGLVGDHAPIHFSPPHAVQLGFETQIVHGLLLASLFSGMLGEELPGPASVIARLDLRFRLPVYVEQKIDLTVEIASLSPATNSVSLALELENDRAIAVDGRATCVLLGRRS